VRICHENGIAVVANLHSMALAKAYADRVVAFKAGELVFDGPPAALSESVLAGVYGEHYAEF
jgi:phosphonate transport system ATP-binding protein